LHLEAVSQRIRPYSQIEAFHLRALGRRQRLRRHQHPDVALWIRSAGEPVALRQFHIRKGVPVLGRRGRHDSGNDLDSASPARPRPTADADKVHVQKARAFQETVSFRAATASSHRLEFKVVQRGFYPSAGYSRQKPPIMSNTGRLCIFSFNCLRYFCCLFSHSAP
jgi:hypothetical protein